MYDEDDFNDVNGWLLLYVVLKFASASFSLVPLAAFYLVRGGYAFHLSGPPSIALLITGIVGVCIGLSAAIGILRTSRWAVSVVGLDLFFNFIVLAFGAYLHGLSSPAFLLREFIQLAILLAWFEYFRTSRRVRNTLGRNLFANASTNQDLTASSEP
jgi:hypothetical protein